MFLLEKVYGSLQTRIGLRYGALPYTLDARSGERSAKWCRLDPALVQSAWALRAPHQLSVRFILFEGACKLLLLVHDHANHDGFELYSWLEHDEDSPKVQFSGVESSVLGDFARCISQVWRQIADEYDALQAGVRQYNALTR
jgi:hypothetical protein